MTLRAAGFERDILIAVLTVATPFCTSSSAWQSGQVIDMMTPLLGIL